MHVIVRSSWRTHLARNQKEDRQKEERRQENLSRRQENHTATRRATKVGTVLENVGKFIEAGAAAVEGAVTSVEKRTGTRKTAAKRTAKKSVAVKRKRKAA